MQNIVLLGATGSIGTQTLDIISRYSDQFKIVGMSANRNAEKLVEIADNCKCESFYLAQEKTGDRRQVRKLDELVRDPSTPLRYGRDEKKSAVGLKKGVDHLVVADHGLNCFETVL